jgi:hypothetical protein
MLKGYDIIARAVEEGIESGWNKAHKNEGIISKEVVIDSITKNVMNCLDEIMNFDKINH